MQDQSHNPRRAFSTDVRLAVITRMCLWSYFGYRSLRRGTGVACLPFLFLLLGGVTLARCRSARAAASARQLTAVGDGGGFAVPGNRAYCITSIHTPPPL